MHSVGNIVRSESQGQCVKKGRSFPCVRENSFFRHVGALTSANSSRVAAEFISPARKRWEKWESGASPIGATPVHTHTSSHAAIETCNTLQVLWRSLT